MAQARTTAKNTFGEGLIMDFAPDNTLANILTNALNATLLTFNGNEMSLQNDMGNGRVESAYLPEGYVPVGTCEFGDIIYIVSYNPILNKSQIGCFPSPERNISNKEISKLDLGVSPNEFTGIVTGFDNKISAGTGKVKTTSIKKVIFGSNNIGAGDKFIISWGDSGKGNQNKISNFGNTSHNIKSPKKYWPKLTKIHIVSIEDTGKITYLDDSVQWYNLNTENDFIISSEKFEEDGVDTTFNLDQYRHALQCQYSVFQSRVPGKLALMLELETINNFSCGHKTIKRTETYTVDDEETTDEYYDIYFSASWETDNYNINPCGLLVTESKYSHMNPYDPINKKYQDNILYTYDITSENPDNIYDAKRVIEFTRLYKLENPGETYDDFTKNSYYNKILLYLTVKASEDAAGSKIITSSVESRTVLRTYNIGDSITKDRAHIPNNNGDNSSVKRTPTQLSAYSGIYVINPSKLATDSNNNIIYKTFLENKEVYCLPISIPDDVIVNYFKKSVLKKVASVKKIVYDSDSDVLKNAKDSYLIEYTVCPCMPYGPLEHLAVSNKIDFNKNQSGDINLTTWKYYVNSSSITLNFGFETFLKEDENEVVDKVLIEFFDNLGLCATYELTNQESYNAKFTEYFELDLYSSNFRLSGKKLLTLEEGQTIISRQLSENILHACDTSEIYSNIKESEDRANYIYKSEEGIWTQVPEKYSPYDWISDNTTVYLNDAGVLYYGRPYIARIKIFKGILNDLGEVDPSGYEEPIVIDKWMWTAPVFNDYYGTVLDFGECLLTCGLDFLASFDGRKLSLEKRTTLYHNLKNITSLDFDSYKSLGALVTTIGIGDSDGKERGTKTGNIYFYGEPCLLDSFGSSLFLDNSAIEKIVIDFALDEIKINDPRDSIEYKTIYEDNYISEQGLLYPRINTTSEGTFDLILSSYGSNFLNTLSSFYTPKNIGNLTKLNDLYTEGGLADEYYDLFDLELKFPMLVKKNFKETVSYLDSYGETITKNLTFNRIPASSWKLNKNADGTPKYSMIPALMMRGVKFNKMIANEAQTKTVDKLLEPCISNANDLSTYGIELDSSGNPYFKYILYLTASEPGGKDGYLDSYVIEFNGSTSSKMRSLRHINGGNDMTAPLDDDKYLEAFSSHLSGYKFLLVAFGYGEHGNDDRFKYINAEGLALNNIFSKLGAGIADGEIISKVGIRPVYCAGNTDYPVFSPPLNPGNAADVYSTLGFVSDNKLYCGSDICLMTALSTGNLSQNFNWKTSTPLEYKSAKSYAQVLASFLMQLYRVSNKQLPLTSFKDVARLESFTESWRANIVIRQILEGSDYESLKSSNSTSQYIKILPKDIVYLGLTYNGISLLYYAEAVLYSAGYFEDEFDKLSPNNVCPKIPETIKCIDFKFELPYDVSLLESAYQQNRENGAQIRCLVYNDGEILNNADYRPIISPSDDTKLYLYDGGDTVTAYSDNAKLKLITTFKKVNGEIYGWHGDTAMLTNPQSGFSKAAMFDGESVQINKPSELSGFKSNYNILVVLDKHADNPRISQLRRVNLFKYGKV